MKQRDQVVIRIAMAADEPYAHQITEEMATARGVTRVLAKPFTLQKVSSVIAELQGARLAA